MARSRKALCTVWDYTVITLGTLLYTLAWDSFLIPNGIASGGVTGAATILEFATGFPVSVAYLGINAVLLLLGFLVLGKGFGVKTVYVIILSTILFYLLPKFPVLQSLPGRPLYVGEKILIPILGGLVEALGISWIFRRGGSTGGTDVLALIVDKYYPITPGTVYIVLDSVVIASILLVPGKTFQDMLYGYIAMMTFSLMLDNFLLGAKSTMQLIVFSSNYGKIADYVVHEMDRGVTVIPARGWYTKKDREVLLILVRKNQIQEVTRVIREADPKAFMSVSPVSSVYGEGFERMKTGIHRPRKSMDPSLNQ